MLLKRIYDRSASQDQWRPYWRGSDGKIVDNPTPQDIETGKVAKNYAPPVTGVNIVHAGLRQHFSPNFIEGGQAEGWLVIHKNSLMIKGDTVVEYEIVRRPGFYDCYDGTRMPDDSNDKVDGVTKGLAYIRERHGIASASPDPQNPSGYEKINYYDCVRVGGNAPALSQASWLARLKGMIGRG